MIVFELTQEAKDKLEELINEGWDCGINYGYNFEVYSPRSGLKHSAGTSARRWEVDFTRKLPTGRWDNHQYGFHETDVSQAVLDAYAHIRAGDRLLPVGVD